MEHPPGKQLHVHLLIAVPDGLMCAAWARERAWFSRAGGRLRRKAFNRKRIGRRSDEAGDYLMHLEQLVAYLLKGAAPDTCGKLGIDHQNQGYVQGQRVRLSKSLSSQATYDPQFGIERPSRNGPRLRPALIIMPDVRRAQIKKPPTIRYADWL